LNFKGLLKMDLVFALGFQKYFLDQVKNSPEHLEYRNLFQSIIRDPTNNYVFFINYAFSPEEYKSRGYGLPECILGVGDETFIPHEIHKRRKLGNICISHLSGSDVFSNTNPNIEGVILDIAETCDRINADKKTEREFGERTQVGKKGNRWTPLENIILFSWTQNEREKISLINGLTNLGLTSRCRLISYQ